MKTTAQWLDISPGQSKFVHTWHPDAQAPQANVAIIHGLGEHGGRYAPLAGRFVDAGFSVSAFDQQGHGRSPESRGKIRSYQSLLSDISAFMQWNRTQYPEVPTILFGHSMGGNLVINFALRESAELGYVISSSPMLEKAVPVSPIVVRLARWLMRIAPNVKLHSQIIPERLMSDPAEQQMLCEDKLFHNQMTLRLGAGLVDSGHWALEHADQLRSPLLLSHGTSDYMTCYKASVEFARRAGKLCELVVWEGELHDPFRGLHRDAIIARYVDFVHQAVQADAHSGRPKTRARPQELGL